MRRACIILTLCLHASLLYGQARTESDDLQYLSDELVAYPDEDGDYEALHENLAQILSSPFDLNRVTREELQGLHLLSDQLINNFLDYRKVQGTLVDIHELQAVPGFDPEIIRKLLPYIRVVDPATRISRHWIRSAFTSDNSYVITRYQRTFDHTNTSSNVDTEHSPYAGSPDKLYVRFRSAESGNYSVGFTAEKDAGEKMFFKPKNGQWGFDFTSWHVRIKNKGKIKNFIAGDFQAQFGQGLVYGGAFGLGKGGETVVTARRSQAGFLPYTSLNESGYHRGVASSVSIARDLTLSIFYSRVRRDALKESWGDSVVIRSLQTSGYHRTAGELGNRKSITEQNSGAVLHLRRNNLDAGVLLNMINFEFPIRRAPTLYNQYVFSGSGNANAGFYLNVTYQNISFFSEVAQSVGAGRALITGALITPHQKMELALLFRNYQRDYHAFYANAFSESTQPQNENGFYWGWKYRWNRRVHASGYFDMFAFPWLGFRRYAPSHGYEWLLRLSYQPSRQVTMFVQVREESKARNASDPGALYKAIQGIKRNVAIHSDFRTGRNIRLKSRLQYNTFDQDANKTQGLVLSQDATFVFGRFKLSGRHAVFHTDSFDNRHYLYETDAWLSYSFPAYSGIGVRNYALLEIRVHKQLTVWLRYARTRLSDVRDESRQAHTMEGNRRNDVKFQVRFNF